MRLVSILSIGRVVDWLARAIGWSPVGRKVRLCEAEGPDANLFEQVTGTVVSIDDGVMSVACDTEGDHGPRGPSRIALTPRHVGWTPFSMMLCKIGVIARTQAENGREAIAIATAGTADRGRKS